MVETRRRITKADFDLVAEQVKSEYDGRKHRRRDMEKTWAEVDRQLAMKCDIRFKQTRNGTIDPGKAWMPELEEPLQSQALEILTADARRMMFPDVGGYFRAHVAMSDDYLRNVDFQSLLVGDETEVPSQINQDNADKLLEGWHEHFQNQYDFAGNWDVLNAEAFKYGTFAARGRLATKEVFAHTSKGVVRKKQKFPMMVPRPIKNTYLDDSQHVVMSEGMVVGASTIFVTRQKLADLKLAANKGSTDPEDVFGGWMPDQVKRIPAEDTDDIELLEYEGDLIIPRKTVRSIFVPNVIATIAVGKDCRLVRLRINKHEFPSYFSHTYHNEGFGPYGSGPLMKGMPIQKAATEFLNRFVQWAVLNTEPPVSYDPMDPYFSGTGGPNIEPRALWRTTSGVTINPIGDGSALLQAYLSMVAKYEDLTGINAPRLGAQTLSHTTAFAKEAELNRGTVRTVDYVKSCLDNPFEKWLHMERELGKIAMSGKQPFYISDYGGWVELEKNQVPDLATYEVFGAGGPAEDREKVLRKQAAINQTIQLEQLRLQAGLPGDPLDINAIQRQTMRDGGMTDVDAFFGQGEPVDPALIQPAAVEGATRIANTSQKQLG